MDFIRMLDVFNKLFPIFILLIGGMVAFYLYAKKKGWIKKNHKDEKLVDVHTAKKEPISNFNIIEDIVSNYIITENKTKFTTGLGCVGVTWNKLSLQERKIILDAYLEFYNLVDWNVQFYTQSRKMDVASNINSIKEVLTQYENELKKVEEEVISLKKIIEQSPSQEGIYKQQMKELESKYNFLTWQVQHKQEEISYAIAVSLDETAPQFDLYILFSYEYDDIQFSTSYTGQEILKMAHSQLETKLRNVISVLARCNVQASVLSQAQIAEVVHRAYNLSDADVISFADKLETSSFDLVTTTNYIAQLNAEYELEKLQDELFEDEIKKRESELLGVNV